MKRIGVLIPETNLVVEDEIYKLYENNVISTNDVIFHILRTPFNTRYSKDYNKFLKEITINQKEIIKNLKIENLDYLSSFCTSAAEMMKDYQSNMCFNSADSLVEAGKFLEINKCLLITPYNEFIGLGIEELLERNDIKIVKKKHINLLHSFDYVAYGYKKLANLIFKEYSNECENIIISCTNLPTMHFINKIEKKLNTKIVSSNSSMFWKIIKDNKIFYNDRKIGKLFQKKI